MSKRRTPDPYPPAIMGHKIWGKIVPYFQKNKSSDKGRAHFTLAASMPARLQNEVMAIGTEDGSPGIPCGNPNCCVGGTIQPFFRHASRGKKPSVITMRLTGGDSTPHKSCKLVGAVKAQITYLQHAIGQAGNSVRQVNERARLEKERARRERADRQMSLPLPRPRDPGAPRDPGDPRDPGGHLVF